MARKKQISAATILILIVSLVTAGYVFNYFCGCLFQDPIEVGVDSLDRLNQPPIIVYPIGDPPANTTFTISTGALTDGEPVDVYQYWYFWPGCTLAPTSPLCQAGHPANDWEPVYIYWKVTNPAAPVLLAVYSRIHFYFWHQTGGAAVTLNGTQIIVSFSAKYHTPTVDTLSLSQFFKPANASISIPFNQNAAPPFVAGAWYYSVTNGGPHQLLVWLDPGSPPATGPTAYENSTSGNAGPVDPFSLYGTGRNFVLGFLVGGAAALIIGVFLTAVRIDIRGFKKVLRIR